MSSQTDLYDQLLDDVITLTARQDLADESAIALRTATQTVHGAFNFPRDLVTKFVKLPNPSFLTGLDIQVLLERFRALSTVRITDINDNPVNSPEIDIVEIGDIYDPEYRTIKNNIAYVAGTALNIRSSISAYGYLIDFYQVPFVRREQYNSWIAQLYSDPILYLAASIVLQTNGNEEKAASYMRMYTGILLPQLISSFGQSAMR